MMTHNISQHFTYLVSYIGPAKINILDSVERSADSNGLTANDSNE